MSPGRNRSVSPVPSLGKSRSVSPVAPPSPGRGRVARVLGRHSLPSTLASLPPALS